MTKIKISDINVSNDKAVWKKCKKLYRNEKYHFLFKHRLANGEIRDVDVYSGLINQKGKNLLYSIVHDISIQKKAEIALRNNKASD